MDVNPNNTDYVPAIGKRLTAGITYSIFSLIGTFINLLVGYVMMKKRKNFNSPFYILMGHIIIASLGVLMGQFVVVIPLSFAGRPLYGTGTLMIALSSGDTLFYLTIFFVSFIISVNRFACIFSKKLHWLLFEGFRFYITCAIPWLLGLFWVAYTTIIGCPKVFRHDVFYYTYRCPHPMTNKHQEIFMSITDKLGYIGPAVMMLFYVCVIAYLWRWRKYDPINKTNINLSIQALLVCFAFEIETLLFTFLPKLTPDWGVFVVSLLLDYALIFNASVNPLILILMNRKIQVFIKKIFKTDRDENDVNAITNQRVFEYSTSDFQRDYHNNTKLS